MPSYFLSEAEAQRYLESRIFFHPKVASKVVNYLNLVDPLDLILDVGCGTGQSSLAFAPFAKKVLAIDPSEAMLKRAHKSENIEYKYGKAEEIDSLHISADMIIAGQSFHWFEKRLFYSKARKILKAGGYLIIFTHALNHIELQKFESDFPSPFIQNNKNKEEAAIFDFEHIDFLIHSESIRIKKKELYQYFLTLSSVQQAMNMNEKDAQEKLSRYFKDIEDEDEIKLSSDSAIWILKKN